MVDHQPLRRRHYLGGKTPAAGPTCAQRRPSCSSTPTSRSASRAPPRRATATSATPTVTICSTYMKAAAPSARRSAIWRWRGRLCLCAARRRAPLPARRGEDAALVHDGVRRRPQAAFAVAFPVGQLRMDAPYCHRDFRRPVFNGPSDEGLRALDVKHGWTISAFEYQASPLDVVGWDGAVYPWAFPIEAFQPHVVRRYTCRRRGMARSPRAERSSVASCHVSSTSRPTQSRVPIRTARSTVTRCCSIAVATSRHAKESAPRRSRTIRRAFRTALTRARTKRQSARHARTTRGDARHDAAAHPHERGARHRGRALPRLVPVAASASDAPSRRLRRKPCREPFFIALAPSRWRPKWKSSSTSRR